MVDITQVVDIKSAQELDYDGRKLNSAEKKLLEDENLKEANGVTADLPRLKKAVELLEVIIKAKKENSFNEELYVKLNNARSEKEIIKALNKNNLYYQSAIDHLISKRTNPSDGSDKNRDDLDKLVDDRNTKISTLEARIKKLLLFEEELATDQGNLVVKYEKAKEDIEALQDLKVLMREGTVAAGRPLHGVVLNKYKDIDGTTVIGTPAAPHHSNELLDDIVTDNLAIVNEKKQFFNTNVRSYFGRGWISKDSLEIVGLQIWEVFKEIGKSNFFAKAGVTGPDKNRLEGYWDEFEKLEWSWTTGSSSYPKFYTKADGSIITTEVSNRSNDVWPEKCFDLEKLREIISLTFADPISDDFAKLFGDQERTWRWMGYSKQPYGGWTDPNKIYTIENWLKTDYPELMSEKGKLCIEKTKNRAGHVAFIKDLFTKYGTNTFFTQAELASIRSYFELKRINSLREVNYIKSLRLDPRISKELIGDEELLEITTLSQNAGYKKKKDLSVGFSSSGMDYGKRSDNYHLVLPLIGKTIESDSGRTDTRIDRDKVGTVEYRIDTSPLDIKISRKRAELITLEGRKNVVSASGAKFYEDLLNLRLQKAALEQEIIEFEAEKMRLAKQDPATIKAEFKAIFGDDLNASILKKFDRGQIIKLQAKLNAIRNKENPMEQWFVDAETKLNNDVVNPLKVQDGIINLWEGSADTTNARLDNCPDNDELEKYRKAYEEAAKLVKLRQDEENEQEAIRKRIKGETTPPIPTPVSDLTSEKLTTLFNFAVDKTLADKWTTITEAQLNSIVLNDYAPTKLKHDPLMAHLSEKGDVDKDKYDNSTTKKQASWENFLKKGSEKVIKTIVMHENDDIFKDTPDDEEKNKKIKEMREDTDAGYNDDPKQNKFDKTRYGDPTAGKESDVTTEHILNYLYDKKLGKVKQQSTAWETTTDGGSGDPGKVENKSWFVFGGSNWRPYVTYIGGFLVIVSVVMFIFWNQISDWWNGPTEEDGKGEVEKDKDEEE